MTARRPGDTSPPPLVSTFTWATSNDDAKRGAFGYSWSLADARIHGGGSAAGLEGELKGSRCWERSAAEGGPTGWGYVPPLLGLIGLRRRRRALNAQAAGA